MKIGLIGTGHMGTAILAGALQKRIVCGADIFLYDKISAKARRTGRRWKSTVCATLESLALKSDILLLAVKPQDLAEVGASLRPHLRKSHTIVSILAGTPVQKLRKALGPRPAVIRAMPNLGAGVGCAMTVLTGGNRKAMRLSETLFQGCGETMQLPEKYFDLVTAVSGSGPAYFFLLMEALTDAARKAGLTERQAALLAVQTAAGAGILAAQNRAVGPAEWRRRVTSKGGTTEAALKILTRGGFSVLVRKAVNRAVRRGRELSRI